MTCHRSLARSIRGLAFLLLLVFRALSAALLLVVQALVLTRLILASFGDLIGFCRSTSVLVCFSAPLLHVLSCEGLRRLVFRGAQWRQRRVRLRGFKAGIDVERSLLIFVDQISCVARLLQYLRHF